MDYELIALSQLKDDHLKQLAELHHFSDAYSAG
jgi:hypothetical protein